MRVRNFVKHRNEYDTSTFWLEDGEENEIANSRRGMPDFLTEANGQQWFIIEENDEQTTAIDFETYDLISNFVFNNAKNFEPEEFAYVVAKICEPWGDGVDILEPTE